MEQHEHEWREEAAEFLRRWRQVWAFAGGIGDGLLALYADPTRYYHNVRHIVDCLTVYEQMGAGDTAGNIACDVLSLALFFHDAIYDARRGDNEERSAELAEAWLGSSLPSPALRKVRRLILATRHRTPPEDAMEQLIVDIDLSILGSCREKFLEYDRAIRAEYAHVTDADYRVGRARVLRGFLARPRIFYTPMFEEHYEAAARVNLSETLLRLEGG